MRIRISTAALAAASVLATASLASPAAAADGVTISGDLAVDILGPLSGGSEHKAYELDLLTVTLEADLEKLMSWKGGSAALTFQNSSGDRPNQDIGVLEGVDNNEVVGRRGRLFEAWIQQAWSNGSLRLGFQDISAEFNATDSAGVLIGPQFGLPSELAATGPGGPSTYPQSGVAARLNFNPTKNSYIRGAVFNAHVGNVGDPGGPDFSFDEGVVEIVEAGWKDGDSIAFGAWRYSKRQADLFDVDSAGDPVPRVTQGAYVMAEHPFVDGGEKDRSVTGFVRAGFSDGDTGPFRGSWQTGVLVTHAVAGRDDSQFSFGVDQAFLGGKYRAASAAGGAPLQSTETHFEITYVDKVFERVTIQPDLQYVLSPGGDSHAKDALVALVRFDFTFGGK